MVQGMGKPSKVMTPINQEAARLLREAFDNAPVNREMLAELSGVPEGTLGKILSGGAPISAEQFRPQGVTVVTHSDNSRAGAKMPPKTDAAICSCRSCAFGSRWP